LPLVLNDHRASPKTSLAVLSSCEPAVLAFDDCPFADEINPKAKRRMRILYIPALMAAK
jgi:hypothetical protein